MRTDACVVHHGDCLDVLRGMPEASVDSVVTDPPYGLSDHKPEEVVACLTAWLAGEEYRPKARGGFMNRSWDAWVPGPEVWREVLRVLKPGGHACIFAGSRSMDLMAMAVRLAGFELRDTCMWLHGQGFAKGRNVGKAIDAEAGVEREVVGVHPFAARKPNGTWTGEVYGDEPGHASGPKLTVSATPEAAKWEGWNTQLKPGYEPILLCRKPLAEPTVASQVLATGTGALNVDACRVGIDKSERETIDSRSGADHDGRQVFGRGITRADGERFKSHAAGRWPANLVTDGSPEVLDAFGRFGERSSHDTRDRGGLRGHASPSPTNFKRGSRGSLPAGRGDTGTAARFFPALGFGEDELRFHYSAKANKRDRAGSKHCCVKPQKLLRWLARLITPPGGTILDPFAGSGSLGTAALAEGFNAILIERDAAYVQDIHRRLAALRDEAPLLAEVVAA